MSKLPVAFTSHPGVESVLTGWRHGGIHYKFFITLRDGWTFSRGIYKAGKRAAPFDSVAEFEFAAPVKA